MAKPNDMPEFHSVKVSLTENIPVPPMANLAKLTHAACASSDAPLSCKGGLRHD